MTDNLKLWRSVEKTPPAHTKAITGKSYQGTSPKPYYLVQKATETFGPVGIGWGFTIEGERVEDGADGERLHIARVKVWYLWDGKRGEVEHIGGTPFSGKRSNGKTFVDEDAPKKSVTDALVKALSMIGFAGDIFMGRYDDSKYVSELRADERREFADTNSARVSPPVAARNAGAVPSGAPVDGAAKSAAPATDSPALAALTMAMKLAKTAADLDAWEADNAEAISALDMDEAQKLRSRVDWWKANKLARAA